MNILFAISLPHEQEYLFDNIPPELKGNPRSYPDAARLALGEYGLTIRGNKNPYEIYPIGEPGWGPGVMAGEVRFLARGPEFRWLNPRSTAEEINLLASIERHRTVMTGKSLYRPLVAWLDSLSTPAGPRGLWITPGGCWRAQIQPVLKSIGCEYWAWEIGMTEVCKQVVHPAAADPWAALTAMVTSAE